jgi:hypothetical protein
MGSVTFGLFLFCISGKHVPTTSTAECEETICGPDRVNRPERYKL